MIATTRNTQANEVPSDRPLDRGGVREIRDILPEVLAQYDLRPKLGRGAPRDQRRRTVQRMLVG